MAALYHLHILQPIVKLFAVLFHKTMGLSGAESLAGSSNIFIDVESAMTIRPYVDRMTRSELLTLITCGILILSYTLCGFAHVASVGIFIGGIGGIGALAPARRGDLSSLGIRALVGATLATLMTGALAGTSPGSTTTARQGCWVSECPWPPPSVPGHANGARAGLKPAPTPRRDVVPILSGSACE